MAPNDEYSKGGDTNPSCDTLATSQGVGNRGVNGIGTVALLKEAVHVVTKMEVDAKGMLTFRRHTRAVSRHDKPCFELGHCKF